MMQEWFHTAKLGIFVHWGVYAVGRRGRESWPIARAGVSYDEYLKELKSFDADSYDPQAWAALFKKAGAQYAVLTTKHHDGITLWPSTAGSPSVSDQCGDLVRPFCESLRTEGLRACLYFSHCDWSCIPHMKALSGLSETEILEKRAQVTDWISLIGGLDRPRAEEPRFNDQSLDHWEAFLDLHRHQIKELLTEYHPIDLIWFDVMWGQGFYDYRCEELREFIHQLSPKTIINSRMDGYGDYETPEQFIPVYPPKGPWELCMTTNNTWSYTGKESDYKTTYELITMFCECLGMGGNLLLNVGPDEHGVIPSQQIELLESMGAWIERNKDGVYETQHGLPAGYTPHQTSLSLDRQTLYVYLAHRPTVKDEAISIKGIHNEINSISTLGTAAQCDYKRIGGAPWLGVPGALWISIPELGYDPVVTVLKIELDGELQLHSGEGVEIDLN